MSGFNKYPFTSTLHEESAKPIINILTVILTAMFFFVVLGWFNFVIAWYDRLTTKDKKHKDRTLLDLGFAILWTLLTFIVYYIIKYYGDNYGTTTNSDHPLLTNDNIGDSITLGTIGI